MKKSGCFCDQTQVEDFNGSPVGEEKLNLFYISTVC